MTDAALVFLAAVALVAAVALYAAGGAVRCAACGRRCDGIRAGGTVDRPICARCVQ